MFIQKYKARASLYIAFHHKAQYLRYKCPCISHSRGGSDQPDFPHIGPRWGWGHSQYCSFTQTLPLVGLRSVTGSKAVGHCIVQQYDSHLIRHHIAAATPEGGAHLSMVVCGQHVGSMDVVPDGDNGNERLTPCVLRSEHSD